MPHKVHLNRIHSFQTKILDWYSQNGRDFPWRKSRLTNYQLIISEILLQRTKAETVAKFYNAFLSRYPNWHSLKRTKLSSLENVLKPIGLYRQRASSLKKLAREMVNRNGRLPQTKEDIEKLPFAGQYITNAILLLIKKVPSPLLDVNMARVLERYFGQRKLSDIRYDPYLQDLSWRVANHKDSKKINWGILDFAALICLKKSPNCKICIFNNSCTLFNQTFSV
jgi:A/G-specific adenine glycosylase